VCNLGVSNPILDPFQLGIIIQVPGQQVPMHLDVGGDVAIGIVLMIIIFF
jgi:hypothetical protein